MEYSERNEQSRGSHSSNGVNALASRAEETMRELRDQARMQAEYRVHEASARAQQRIDSERDRFASRIEEAAGRVRQRADTGGSLGHAAGEQVASRMEAAAGYLHQRHTEEIAGDVATYVKGHPIQTVIAAAVLGYLFGRLSS